MDLTWFLSKCLHFQDIFALICDLALKFTWELPWKSFFNLFLKAIHSLDDENNFV